MANFSIARDKETLIPYIKAALAVKRRHPLLGQPVDAADVDEETPSNGNMVRRSTAAP